MDLLSSVQYKSKFFFLLLKNILASINCNDIMKENEDWGLESQFSIFTNIFCNKDTKSP